MGQTKAGLDRPFYFGASKFDAVQRRANLPRPTYPDELPVVALRKEIAAAVAAHPVVIVCGETGSGKTTQLPKICLELERGVNGLIGHTQPRRIAARTVAARIAAELKSPLGHAVGYKVRFSDRLSEHTYIKVMTDGILLAETQGDRLLRNYDTLIIDEAHERSLNIDFLLGYVKRLLPRRPELKLIITSATIDAERFSRHFDGAPVIEVSGRTYPVEIRYRPLDDPDSDNESTLEEAIVDAADELAREPGGGDILVFLPGEREIRDTAEALRKHAFGRVSPAMRHVEILPLYARLSFEEQQRVFRRSASASRIVLATNVAETSLTVPGIHYVIDTGLARINRYSYRNKVEQLQVEKISRAAADQRAGRCGRVAAGVCIRLYSEGDYAARPQYTDPEILRSSLAHVILRMKALRIGDVEDFPFLEPPAPRMVADGYQLLTELNAVDEKRNLSALGVRLAGFPIDPRIARMILAAQSEACLTEILIIAAALTIQDPRERPLDKAEAADRAHEPFRDERSDFMGYLELWKFFDGALKHRKSHRKLQALVHEHFLSHRRMREWRDVHAQLAALAGDMGLHPNENPAGYSEIHRALLAGLLGNIGFKNEDGEYVGARGIKFAIFPGSGLRKSQPKWVMAAELVETARLYARTVARIEPEWIEPLARHLVERHYFDPHWERERAMVVAFERVTLYGLTVVSRRRVHYGPIHPAEAREIFIRQALVVGEYETRAPFFEHNRRLIRDVQALEHKARRRDVLVNDEAIYAFYDGLIPEGIVNGAGFEKWRREAERADPRLLHLTREYLMRHAAADITEAQFPETMRVGEADLRLRYRFEPGHPLDGVTATVPLHLLNTLDAACFEWLVPGMVREKVVHAFRSLPKPIRRYLVPVPEQVTLFLEEQDRARGGSDRASFAAVLARHVQRAAGKPLEPALLEDIEYPPHLRMNFCVVDDAGHELATGRDLAALQSRLGEAAQLTFGTKAEAAVERENIRTWDFGDLPREIAFTRNGRRLKGYPALVDEGDRVSIKLFDVPDAAVDAMRAGAVRLIRIALREQMKQLERNLRALDPAFLHLRTVASADDLKEDVIAAIADRAFIGEDAVPRAQREYEAQLARARTRLPAVTETALGLYADIAAEYQRVTLRLVKSGSALARPVADIQAQLRRLIYLGFFRSTPWERLSQLPRYLKAMQVRLDKYPRDPERDAKHAGSISELWKRYEERLARQRKAGVVDPRLAEFLWHIEELRVSLYAQELKTPYPVSYKRLDKLWNAMR